MVTTRKICAGAYHIIDNGKDTYFFACRVCRGLWEVTNGDDTVLHHASTKKAAVTWVFNNYLVWGE